MSDLLSGGLALTISNAVSWLFLDATLERDVPGTITDPADPPVFGSPLVFPCKAIEDQFSVGLLAAGLVSNTDIKVLILAETLATTPLPLDRITIRGKTLMIVPAEASGQPAVTSDPARATWECRCS